MTYPYDEAQALAFQTDVQATYAEAGQALDLSNIAWVSRTVFDAVTLGYPASRAKHLAELRAALGLQPPPIPPITVDIRKWRGAFCIPGALPGIPYGDGQRIWTPAYGCYDDNWRAQILAAFVQRGYTHFVYNTASPNGVYHNDYPITSDDPVRARRDLIEIRAAGLVPVCPAFDDTMLDAPLESFRQNADLIPICFPMWEMNGPLQGDTARINACVLTTRAAAPEADCYIHFTSGHGAGGEPEGAWWQWAASVGVVGLLSQDDGYNRKPDGDPIGTAAGLTDTARHFRGEVAGWEGLHLLNVAFEMTTTPAYHSGWSEAQCVAYGDYIKAHAIGIAGVCDGCSS